MAGLLPDLLGRAAELYGSRLAVALETERLSYAELEADSNRFARSLRAQGVGRGDRVMLWLPKCPRAVVALYGIMKAGATYVPVDPGAPPARVAFIARDCAVAGVVTLRDRLSRLEEALASGAPIRALWTADRDDQSEAPAKHPIVPWAALGAESAEAAETPASADDLAYVLYTSGSTGEPKGVMHSHRSALAFVEWAALKFEVSPEDRLSNHAPFHFDLSTFDLFAAAQAGASVHLVPPRMAAFPAAIARFLVEARLTVWYCTPSTLALLVGHGGLAAADISALRVLLFAGEVMPVPLLQRLMELAPAARFANLYGPTETNVCTWHEVRESPVSGQPIPIGRACCGDEALVLDDAEWPVADGEVGELWVRGPTVMRGYWGRPERTTEVLRAPASGGAPAYRTGDLVLRAADGMLAFVGRRDHQVKTRGYRVELGEVEAALNAHAGVAEAVVLAVPDPEIGSRLHAVVVLQPGAGVDEKELKRHCGARIPPYMLPERILLRPSLPRTSSGKVDRRALEDVIERTR